jgi:3-oxoacyl-[acyl-carrier protein] reductase
VSGGSTGSPTGGRFADIEIGQTAELSHDITERDVDEFRRLTGDVNPLHSDPAFASSTSFRRPVVYGMLTASFISTIIGNHLPGSGALWTRQSLEFLQPAFVGDTLHVVARVKRKSVATRSIVLDIHITNQRGQTILTGESTVKILEPRTQKSQAMSDHTRTVVVTGGSRGIGAATVRRLAAEGHAVAFTYRQSVDEAEALAREIAAAGGRVLPMKADVSVEGDVERLFVTAAREFGPVTGIVHGAAAPSLLRHVADLRWEDYQRQLDVQIRGALLCTQAALAGMLDAQDGALVFIGSTAGEGAPPAQQSEYVVAKAALQALARSIAVEYGPQGIRCNVVAPGMTETDMIADLPEKAKLLTRMQTPLRKLGQPEDIAEMIAFLVSARARHITGATMRVCGGAVMA